MNKVKVGIIDLNTGNIFSVLKVFKQIHNQVEIIEKYGGDKSFSHIVVPG